MIGHSRFEQLVQACTGADQRQWKSAVIDVMDTAEFCLAWFQDKKLLFTAADVVAMTELVLVREEALARQGLDTAADP